MSFDKAIEILTDELCHIRHHLLEQGKAPEYYAELRQLVTALEMGISALTKWSENLMRGIAEAYGGKTSGPVFMDDATPAAQAVPSPMIEAARNGEVYL